MGFARMINRARHRRAVAVMAAIALISMLAIGPRGAFALIQQIGDSPSPATGHAQVIAQGVSTLPDTSSAWRVTQATAGSLDAGEPTNYALGFTAATDGGVLVNDYTTGLQSRLSSGEAAFTSSGAFQQHASLSGDNVSYLRIGLVSGNGADGAGEGVVYASDSFGSPEGRRDIDLLRDVLGEGESTTVNAGSAPSLVYAVTGEVVIDDGDNTTTLQAGQGTTVDGEFSIESQASQSIVLAAVIGNDVPAPPRVTGTVTLDIRACPADVTKEQLEASAAEGSSAAFEPCVGLADPAKAGLEIGLTPNGGDALALKEADLGEDDGVVTWNTLPFGDYSLGDITAYPDGYNDSVMSDGNLNLGDHGDFTLNRDNPDVSRVIYLLHEPTATGSISVAFYSCRVATLDDFDPAACSPYVGEVPTELQVNGSDTPLTLADAERGGANDYTWTDLAVATIEDPASSDDGFYELSFVLPGEMSTPEIIVDGATLQEESGTYTLALTPEHPNAVVSYYVVNLNDSQGSLYLGGVTCPTVDSSLSECFANGTVPLAAVTITSAGGASIDQASAELSGDYYHWTGLSFDDTYSISSGNIVAPDGYEIREIVDDSTGVSGDPLELSFSSDAPTQTVFVYLVPIGEDAGTPVDTDGDGLSDDDETSLGTSIDSADTDADCHSDGSEVEASTDPLDAASFPEGDCNI
jgi:hypothetical protein